MKRSILSLALLSFGAMAQVSPMASYEVSDIGENMVPTVWENMKDNFITKSECYNRAISWNYDLNKKFGINSKKIIIHYTYKFNQELSSKWGFHIAPVIKVEGTDRVFDKGFVPWLHAPLSRQMWQEKFLLDGTKELVKKAKELRQDIKEQMEDYRKLNRDSSNFSYKSAKIRAKVNELRSEMRRFHVTDEELKQQKPKKIEQFTRWAEFYEAEQAKYPEGSRTYKAVTYQMKYAKKMLREIEKDITNAAHIQCQPITHIEELDFKQTEAWCYTQDVSMHYWGIPQLRLLNYGQYDKPYKSTLEEKRVNGEQYARDDFMMEQVWIARKQAFGKKLYKELWAKEFQAKEAAEEALEQAKKQKKADLKAEKKRKKQEARAERKRKKEEARRRRRNS